MFTTMLLLYQVIKAMVKQRNSMIKTMLLLYQSFILT